MLWYTAATWPQRTPFIFSHGVYTPRLCVSVFRFFVFFYSHSTAAPDSIPCVSFYPASNQVQHVFFPIKIRYTQSNRWIRLFFTISRSRYGLFFFLFVCLSQRGRDERKLEIKCDWNRAWETAFLWSLNTLHTAIKCVFVSSFKCVNIISKQENVWWSN